MHDSFISAEIAAGEGEPATTNYHFSLGCRVVQWKLVLVLHVKESRRLRWGPFPFGFGSNPRCVHLMLARRVGFLARLLNLPV